MKVFKVLCTLLVIGVLSTSQVMAEQGELSFSYDVQESVVADQGIKELRVYQDSSDNMIASVDPLSGGLTVLVDIEECSNFWATYATDKDESDRTDYVPACVPDLKDPDRTIKVSSVEGLVITIEFDPSKFKSEGIE